MEIKTIKDIKDFKGKKILLRVDFNVPLDKKGDISDDSRILESLETINFLLEKKAKIIIISHLGRPKGEFKKEFTLKNVSNHLSKLIKKKIKFLEEKKVINKEVKKEIKKMKEGEIIILENIRFRPEEEKCDETFSKELANLGEIFINDAFGTAHRAHSSTVEIAKYIPAYAGFLMEKEIKALSPLINSEPKYPLVIIFGGAKIDTKIDVIKNFIEKADFFLIGGALANTFLIAAGYNVGESLYEKDKIKTAREIMMECEKQKTHFIIPHDVIVADEISNNTEIADIPIEDVIENMKILDIGKWTTEKYCNTINNAGTVIWNGPLGLYEYEPFKKGTCTVAKTLANHECKSIIGGGDTIDALKKCNIPAEGFSHISTGGGACMEFLGGKKLPGINIFKK